MTTSGRSVLVIGGGVAGMAAGLALEKAGLSPTVFEAYDRTADGVGAFLTVAVNGLVALRGLDLTPEALGGFPTPRMELFLGDGRKLTTFDFGASTSGLEARTVGRAELYAALRNEAERRGVPVVYEKRLVGAERIAGTVHAHFDDGTTATGDVLVGADGLRSLVRTIIDPKAPSARYVGLLNAGGYARGITVPGEVGTMRMYFGKRCFLGYMPAPDGSVWWFANPARKVEPSRQELASISSEAWRAELLSLFADDDTPARAIVEATPELFAGWATYDFPRVPRWHRDGMVLVGDAAHAASPSSGQGASMAIEDAVVLAQALRDAPAVETAFTRYEAARRKRVEAVVAAGKRNGDGKTPGAFGRVIRDFALSMIFRKPPKENPWAFLEREPVVWREAQAGA